MVKKTILQKETKISPDKNYGVVKIQSKKLNPYVGKKVNIKITEVKP